ncbi:MAG: SlyX family protein [Marinosulfonomonas sp.]|nr:SlyX family protein [Marinosulfonomonas sp.]
MDARVTKLEELAAHLGAVVDDLSDIVARQEKELAVLQRRMAIVMEREAQRELAEGGTVPLTDQKPPHW